jgi:hypothetical protein
MKKRIITFLIIMLFCVINCFAQKAKRSLANSGIAYTYPISGIKVDGDITDWPNKIVHYPINKIFGTKPKGKNDFNVYFQLAYNLSERSLYG